MTNFQTIDRRKAWLNRISFCTMQKWFRMQKWIQLRKIDMEKLQIEFMHHLYENWQIISIGLLVASVNFDSPSGEIVFSFMASSSYVGLVWSQIMYIYAKDKKKKGASHRAPMHCEIHIIMPSHTKSKKNIRRDSRYDLSPRSIPTHTSP